MASLLVELGRAVRGLSFYREGDPACRALLDRTWIAWSGELTRAGPIELRVGESGFIAPDVHDRIPFDHLEDLAEAMGRHGIDRIRISNDLTRDALQALAELLSRTETAIVQAGGIVQALRHRCSLGIVLNDSEDQPSASRQTLGVVPIRLPQAPDNGFQSRDPRPGGEMRVSAEKPSMDDGPLEAPPTDARSEGLLTRLIELDRCSDDAAYEFLAQRIVRSAIELFEVGLRDECHRSVLVLADHAVGDGGRSGLQARAAQRLCSELASGDRLEALIDRARSNDTRVAVRATQVLLQLGESVIPALLDRLAASAAPDADAQLTAILIVLGEPTATHLARVIGEADETRSLLAIRLARELQHPALVAPLIAALEDDRSALRHEAAKSLAHLGGDAAVHGLINALSSDREDVPELAARCLGALRDPRGVQPLLAALERAMRKTNGSRARSIIRALGSLGHERATPRLVALLERRTLLRRKALREMQLAAIAALDNIPGREARRTIERAKHHRDRVVREQAILLLATPHDTVSPVNA